MSRYREHWQRSLDSLSRKKHRDPEDILRDIKDYTLRFRKDVKELEDKYKGAYLQEFQRSETTQKSL